VGSLVSACGKGLRTAEVMSAAAVLAFVCAMVFGAPAGAAGALAIDAFKTVKTARDVWKAVEPVAEVLT